MIMELNKFTLRQKKEVKQTITTYIFDVFVREFHSRYDETTRNRVIIRAPAPS